MRLSPRLPSAVALFAALLWVAPAAAEEPRTWQDASGKFSISAKFVSLDAGKVTLEKADGSTVEIALTKLSAADRAYVAKANVPKPAEDDPFQAKPKDGDKAGKAAPETAVDWSQARLVGVNSAPEKWAAAVPPAALGELYADPIALPPKANFFEGVKGVAFSAAARRAVVGYHGSEPGKPTKQTRLVLLDLAAGKQVAAVKTPGEFAPLALADDGKRVLVRRDEFGFSKRDQVELWGVDEGGVTKLSRFTPYGDLTGPERDVRWAAFLEGGRLATVNVGGKLAVWDAATLKPLYFLPTARDAVPALSPDRKLIAFATDKDIGLLDAAAGKVVALRDAPGGMQPALAFSPSGARLARFSFGKIHVWNAATGEQQAELSTVNAGGPGGFCWTSEDHVLVGGRTLFDVATQVRLWDYNGGEFAQQVGGLTWFVASSGDKQPGALVPARVPTAAAKAALAKAMTEPDFVVLKKGTVVRLDCADIADAAERDKAEAAFTARLKAQGMGVGPEGTITLVASTEVGKERDLHYSTFGSFDDMTYKFTEHFARVKFVWQGKTAWESAASNSPGFLVRLKQDQTMNEYLKEHEKPNYAFLQSVELPRLLTRPTGNLAAPGLGSSQVTAAGVR